MNSTVLFTDVNRGLNTFRERGIIVNSVVTSPPYFGLRSYFDENDPLKALEIGTEELVEDYVDRLVRVFRSIREILAPDGTVWLNLGTSYAGSGGAGGDYNSGGQREGQRSYKNKFQTGNGYKRKDLIPIPWLVGLALLQDGWYLRADIIWHKNNAKPEGGVFDRPSRNHEYVLLLTKSPTYFYDKEPFRRKQEAKTVWSVKVRGYRGAHFSTYPTRLIAPMILAGTSEWGHCPTCGRGWRRIVELGEPDEVWKKECGADSQGEYLGKATKDYAGARAEDPSAVKARILAGMRERKTIGWEPTCKCGKDPVPGVILDPFIGSGTTAQVAIGLGRRIVGIELQKDYKPLIEERIAKGLRQKQRLDSMLFNVKTDCQR